jgi:hypothetical protein
MKSTHTGLGITEEDRNVLLKYIRGSLDKFKIADKEEGKFLSFISGLKPDIVGR